MTKIGTLLLPAVLLGTIAFGQSKTVPTPDTTIQHLKSINSTVVNDTSMIISYKALNFFFADKIGSYLSEGGDLSLFNNYATLNSTDGKFSLNHNFKGVDNNGRISSLTTLGVKVNLSDNFATIFDGKRFTNEIGVTFKQTWLGRGSVFFDNTTQSQPLPITAEAVSTRLSQKQRMNRIRAALIIKYTREIREKEKTAKDYADSIEQKDIPGDDSTKAGADLRDDEYQKIFDDYEKQFATDQSKQLSDIENHLYNLISVGWTSIDAYIPVTTTTYTVATDYRSQFTDKTNYPFQLNLTYNHMLEYYDFGRLFLSIGGGLVLNSTVATESLTKTSLTDYINLGGIDTMHLARLKDDDAYVGNYSNFLTPSLKAQAVFFPKSWNVGLSLQAEKNFGTYNPLNTKLGIPIRFNDKDGEPTVNFELQWRINDLFNNLSSGKSLGDKSAIGLSIGLPFSSIIY